MTSDWKVTSEARGHRERGEGRERERARVRGHVVPMQRSPVLLRAAPPEASGCARASLRLSPGGLHFVSLLGEARAPAASVTPPGPQPARGRRRAPRGGRGPETRSSSVPSRQSRPGPVPSPPSPRSAATQATAAPRSPWPCGVRAPCPIAQSAFPRRARFRARGRSRAWRRRPPVPAATARRFFAVFPAAGAKRSVGPADPRPHDAQLPPCLRAAASGHAQVRRGSRRRLGWARAPSSRVCDLIPGPEVRNLAPTICLQNCSALRGAIFKNFGSNFRLA